MRFNGVKKTIGKYKWGSLEARGGKNRWSRNFQILRLDECGNIQMNINDFDFIIQHKISSHVYKKGLSNG